MNINKIKVKFHTPIINAFDYQGRIYRKDPNIKWVGKVHEKIEGHKSFAYLPSEEHWSLYHPKTLNRQIKQNKYYNTL
jgi:hypothetical protein